MSEAISLTLLAGVVGCSRRYLAERFRRETGETVHGYLTRVRLNHAAGDVQAGAKVEAVMLGWGFAARRISIGTSRLGLARLPRSIATSESAPCVTADVRRDL